MFWSLFVLIEWNQLFKNYFSYIFLIQDPLIKQVVYFSIIKLLHMYNFYFPLCYQLHLYFSFLGKGRVSGTVIVL